MTPDEELAHWKKIAGIKETNESSTATQQQYKIGTSEWFSRPVNAEHMPAGFRGRVRKK